MENYNHLKIEPKWQKYWSQKKIYKTKEDAKKPKCYVLDMFPYPSGYGLHVGHPRGYIASDVYARLMKMKGFNVLHPMGYDAFGLPAEQFAIQNKIHPQKAVEENIKTFRKQLDKIGFSYDWDRQVNTTDPKYYKWTQWIFLKLYESWYNKEKSKAEPIESLIKIFEKEGNKNINAACSADVLIFDEKKWNVMNVLEKHDVLMKYRLAYEGFSEVNWCPELGTVLANDEITTGADGKPVSERGNYPVEKKTLRQWFLRITAYADRLISGLDGLNWSPHIKELQKNWIGRSEGSELWFNIKNSDEKIFVFTTRPDTLFGVTYVVLAPENKLVEKLKSQIQNWSEVENYIKLAKSKSEIERTSEGKEKTGVELKGIIVKHPITKEIIPVFISDYVLGHYGTGAVMAVPAHDDRDYAFAKKFNLPIIEVISGGDISKAAYTESGEMVNSGQFDGRKNTEIFKEMTEFAGGKVVTKYKMRDAVFARQRYWGEPIPLIHSSDFDFSGDNNAKITLNFYYKEYWEAMKDGIKKIETRALNPEEKDRYFGDVRVGDILHCTFRDKKTKKIKEEKLFRVKGVKIYKSLKELFNDKLALSKLGIKKVSSLTDLEKAYSVFGEEYLNKIKTNGLIAWDIDLVTVIVPVKLNKLPLKLPNVKSYEPIGTGESPLAGVKDWVKKGYETNTMPGWAGSSWYFLRYMDPKNDKNFVGEKENKYWRQVDMYIGGAEHATGHLLYSRFWNKFLFDYGLIVEDEPFKTYKNLGMILGSDNRKMSKRWGNVINPDDVVKNVGADTLRLYESFMGPFDQEIAWSTDSMVGSRRFLEKAWKLQEKSDKNFVDSEEIQSLLHKTIKKVGEDIESFSANTAVSSMMILVNSLEGQEKISRETYLSFIKILSPFAPHMCEEIWSIFGNKKSLVFEAWPKYDEAKLKSSKVKIAVQINGKHRATVEAPNDSSEEVVEKIVMANPEVVKWLADKKIIKRIFVKNKIFSFVI